MSRATGWLRISKHIAPGITVGITQRDSGRPAGFLGLAAAVSVAALLGLAVGWLIQVSA